MPTSTAGVDVEIIRRFNESAPPDYRIELDLGPCYSEGAPDAPVVLLTLNPGFDETSKVDDHQQRFDGWPLAALHPDANPGMRDWWRPRVAQLVRQSVDVQTLSRRIQNILLLPWASRRWGDCHERLMKDLAPVIEGQAQLVRAAMDRRAVIVLTRGFDLWFKVVPDLRNYDRLIKVKSPRAGAYLTPGNLGDEPFRRVLEAIRGDRDV